MFYTIAGATLLAVQSPLDFQRLELSMPELAAWPLVPIHAADEDGLYRSLDWQRVGARRMIQHYLNVNLNLQVPIHAGCT